jgi:hypothetical protein
MIESKLASLRCGPLGWLGLVPLSLAMIQVRGARPPVLPSLVLTRLPPPTQQQPAHLEPTEGDSERVDDLLGAVVQFLGVGWRERVLISSMSF